MLASYLEHWWVFILQGLLAVVLGLIMLASPIKSVAFLVVLSGLYLVIDGILGTIVGIANRKTVGSLWMVILQGVLSLVIGSIILIWPIMSIGVLFFWISLWLIVSGIVTLVKSVVMHKTIPHVWLSLALGSLQLGLGLLAFGNPIGSIQFIGALFGLALIVMGIFQTAFGFQLHGLKKDVELGQVAVVLS